MTEIIPLDEVSVIRARTDSLRHETDRMWMELERLGRQNDQFRAMEANLKSLHMNKEFMDALTEFGETYATRDAETELDVLAALERAVAPAPVEAGAVDRCPTCRFSRETMSLPGDRPCHDPWHKR